MEFFFDLLLKVNKLLILYQKPFITKLIATKELTIKLIIALPVPGSRYAQAVFDMKILKINTK